jgi:hypothetical protein
MITLPDSRIRIPKQTSAPHISLYSCDFFSRFVLRRSLFCRSDFLSTLKFFDRTRDVVAIVKVGMKDLDELKMGDGLSAMYL